jgi:predicted HD phosphohydrolase
MRPHGWHAIVNDRLFDGVAGAPTAGPPPYGVYEVTPTDRVRVPPRPDRLPDEVAIRIVLSERGTCGTPLPARNSVTRGAARPPSGGPNRSPTSENPAPSASDAQMTKERIVTTRQLTFTRIQDTTADDWAIIATRPDTKLFEELPDRLLGALRFLENVDFYTVNGLEHSLQASTRALGHGRPAEYVVAALLHDVGDLVGPRNHAAVAASILRPYVSERIAWIVEHHTVFQFNHFGHHIGINPDMRDAYLGHPYYEDTAEFVDLYDSESFDPSYDSLPLEELEPLLRQVFDSHERSPFELVNRDP